jgi:hypothetical protein
MLPALEMQASISHGPPMVVMKSVQRMSEARRWWSEPGLAMQASISLGPPVAAKRAVQGESAVRRWCSEPELGRNDPEFQLAVLLVFEGGRRDRATAL